MKHSARVILVLLLLSVANSALAVDGVRRVISYWGYLTNNGTSAICSVLLGPPIPPELIGQRIRECDGSTWSWGNTTCTDYAPTTEYEPCDASTETPSLDEVPSPNLPTLPPPAPKK